MIEPDRTQAQFLKQNIQLLKAENCELKVATAQQALPTLKSSFDLVFLDPPYSLNLWEELAKLADPLITENALIYIEADRELNMLNLPHSWHAIKQTKAGTVRAALYKKVAGR
jgi:16S rRNA (guanine966-N2)-methyltransferase